MVKKIYGINAWEYVETYRYNDKSKAWMEVALGDQDGAAQLTTAFAPDDYMGKGTVLQRDLSNMPLDPDSDLKSKSLARFSPFAANGAWGSNTGLNTSAQGTQPIHNYIVDSTHPDCHFQNWVGTALDTPKQEIDLYMSGMIPHPTWAVPAQNGDHGMSIYDKGTGIMREYFGVSKNASTGVWSGGGGYSIASKGLDNLAKDNYALQQRRGISNVAGMHNSLGFIGISEAINKKINHALCFTLSTALTYNPDGTQASWPARLSDGKLERYGPGGDRYKADNTNMVHDISSVKTITHGQWGRLKSDVDPMYNPNTKLPYKPFTRVIIEAAKKYGLVATDTNLWVNAFNCEQGRTWEHIYGEDPWKYNGLIHNMYVDETTGLSGLDVNDFPWDRTEWAPVDWGRPSPDTNLKPGQLKFWYRT